MNYRFSVLLSGLLVCLLSACSALPVRQIEVTRLVPQTLEVTRQVTQLVPVTVTPPPPLEQTQTVQALLPPTPARSPTPYPIYFPLKDCPASRISVGMYVNVAFGGGRNAIRWTADVTTGENIIGYAAEGENLGVIGGPECSYGWLLWQVRTSSGLKGWTPETDGKRFFLNPVVP